MNPDCLLSGVDGLEFLYGHKETLDGSERDAHRFNIVVRYDLVR
jgi:hypothetical protein